MIGALHFLRPWWWLAWLPLPLMLLALLRSAGGRETLSRLADASLLPYLIQNDETRRRWTLLLVAIAWTLAVAALAGPAWRRAPVALYANGAARVIALSLSNDMLAQDIKPDRMTRARYAVRDLLDASGDAHTALIGYAGDAFVVAPLTPDKQTVLNLLDALTPDVMPAPGNDAARAIDQSVALLQQAHVKGGEIVVVSDDANHAALAAARKARVADVRVDVLGIGTTQGAPVPQSSGGFESGGSNGLELAKRNDAALRDLAVAGGGTYAPLHDDGSGVAAIGAPAAVQGSAANDQRAQLWRDAGAWLLIPLLPLAALAFRRGWLCVLALLFVVPHARAASWDGLWARSDQRALHALQKGDYAAAAQLRDPRWRGAAAYRKGDYAQAAKDFSQGNGARSRYNLGNALAKQGHYDQAIAAYDQALKNKPDMADARSNRQAVVDWMKQHPQPPPQSGNQGAQANAQTAQSSKQQSSKGASAPNAQQSSSNNAQNGARNDARQAQAGANKSGANDSNRADSAQGQTADGKQDTGDSGASSQEDARQRAQTSRAQQALQKELAQRATAEANAGGASTQDHDKKKDATQTFALGATPADDNGKFNPQQRAMLNAVPDDPGALLRAKFMLEWQRRHGHSVDFDPQVDSP